MKSQIRTLLVAAGLTAIAVPALAHAFPRHAEPRAGSTVAKPPATVSIWFDDELQPGMDRLEVTEGGKRLDKGKPVVDPKNPKHLWVALAGGGSGTYAVHWRVLSTDGHVTQGHYTFKVAATPAKR